MFCIKIFFCLVQLVHPHQKIGCGTATLCIVLWIAWVIQLSVYRLSASGICCGVADNYAIVGTKTEYDTTLHIGFSLFLIDIVSLVFIPIMCICCGIYACCMLLCNSV